MVTWTSKIIICVSDWPLSWRTFMATPDMWLFVINSLLLLVYLIIYSVTCLWRYLSSLYSPFAPLSRPGKFAETIVIVTTSLPLNKNGGNNNLFPQYFSSNVIVSEAFLGGKGENLSAKSNRFFSETWITVRHRPSVQSALSFCSSHFLLLQADCSITVAHMSHSTTGMLQFYSRFCFNQSLKYTF